MKKINQYFSFFALSSFIGFIPIESAWSISNRPLRNFAQNYQCGPSHLIPFTIESSSSRRNLYCKGFSHFVDIISNAHKFIEPQPYVIWCWTIIEEWHTCQYPNPKLGMQCRDVAINQGRNFNSEDNIFDLGLKTAQKMYLTELDNRCGSIE